MTKILIVDYSSWKPYEGISEGSGRSEKLWLQSEDGTIGLFKFPKNDPVAKTTTYEHISEHLACQIGKVLNVKTADVKIGTYCDRIGSMSYLVNQSDEALIEGAWFILGKHRHYDVDTMRDSETGKFYSLEYFSEISRSMSDTEVIHRFWIEMMLFDFLIGNSDRHQNNWAFISPIVDKNRNVIRIRPCPLYDNGSSLCCYVKDTELKEYLGKDRNRFNALVNTKSKSLIRINGSDKRRPLHTEVVKHLLQTYPVTKEIADRFIQALDEKAVIQLLDVYPNDLLGDFRKILMINYLLAKIELLKTIRGEADNG